MTVLLKGALVGFMPTFLVPTPNVIVFQYNPETLTHTWRQPDAAPPTTATNPMAVRGMPDESFSFKILIDANEDIATGVSPRAGVAAASGVYSRLAALEMLLYPSGPGHGGLVGAISSAAAADAADRAEQAANADPTNALAQQKAQQTSSVTYATVPMVLFVWGPGRIVPVRLTDLTIDEQLYNETLSPTHAEAQLSLRVLTPAELQAVTADNSVLGALATVAYDYTLGLRQTLAAANLANPAESIIGMIPY
jgi:hypothetical protein